MSATLLYFVPRPELEAKANVEAFIALCRRSNVLNAHEQFDANIWTAGWLKGKNNPHRVIFSTAAAAADNLAEPTLPQPFLDFAKAAIVYLHDKKPVVSQSARISALRYLEAALAEWNRAPHPSAVNIEILEAAVALAQRSVSAAVAYRVAGQLELIAELMRSKGFIDLRQPWLHGLKRPDELGSRISKEALEARQEKLPSAAALRALGAIFQDAVKPIDVLVSGFISLMLCAPERINEVLRLRRHCIVDGDGRFAGKLGLRWSGSKLANDTTKWLPTQMGQVARDAVAKLLKITAPAHEIATWYTANPHTLFLNEHAIQLRGKEFLSMAEVALVLWGDQGTTGSAISWVRNTAKIVPLSEEGTRLQVRFADVESAVLKMLPPTFPKMPGEPQLLCSDALAVSRTNEMHATRATYLCMFDCIDYNLVTNHFGTREDRDSIFARFDFKEDDGSPIELRSHSLRHYLNTLAQLGGLSNAEIAIFSGRADVSQNRAYDHRTSDEVQAPISDALKAGFTTSLVPLGARELFYRSEFKMKGIAAAHTTNYGWCMHNFASAPCQMYRDCINCEEQECVKGDDHKEANLRLLKGETEDLLQQAREALSDDEFGADVWVKHQTKTLERVNGLLKILDDPAVPQGARIRLNLSNAPLITNANERPITFHKSPPYALK